MASHTDQHGKQASAKSKTAKIMRNRTTIRGQWNKGLTKGFTRMKRRLAKAGIREEGV